MDLGIQNRVALVCGGSRGIGRAVARALVREGAHVAIVARDAGGLAAARAALADGAAGRVVAVAADVGRPAELERAVATVEGELGPIELLLCNHGGPPAGRLAALSDDDWQRAIDVGLLGMVRLVRRVLPTMRARRWGRIVTISSTAMRQPREELLLSSTVRAALASFNKAIAAGCAPDNVLVHTICPGPIRTGRIEELARKIAQDRGISVEEAEASLYRDVPMARMGTPEEVATLALSLFSDHMSFATGTTICVDGGQVAATF